MTLAGKVFSNRYEIRREVAQGGMAEVYLAHDQLLNRPVALKVLFPEYAREPSFVERFRREAQAAANLNHPNIVAIYDWGQESGTYFIVMEYVEGRSLRELIRTEAPLEPAVAAEITAEIASALAFAHRNGVVHRDVKPGNVLLTASGNVKVTDFGIARAGASDALTQTGSVMGTATYFSPEQAQGLPVDGRSDVYALGVVLYEMATGVAPFTGDSPVSVAYKHVREDPVPPAERNPAVPPDLERVVLTALAKDPAARYQTADELRADLLRFRRGRPVVGAAAGGGVAAAAPAERTVVGAALPDAAAAADAATTVMSPSVDARGRLTGTAPVVRRQRNTALVWILTLLGLAAVVAAILFAASRLGGAQASVTVPNEQGKKLADAQADLARAHLQASINRVASNSAQVDVVLNQNPAANASAARGSTVTLDVGAGPAQKQIPFDITNGRTEPEVRAELESAGFVVQDVNQANAAAKGTVFDSSPKPGATAAVGSTVKLFVSSGPAPVAIPQVQGQTLQAATLALEQQGFTNIADPVQEPSATVAPDLVTRTDPAAGQSVALSTKITIFVSSGPPTVSLPSVIGMTEAAAKSLLESDGFTVTTLNRVDDANVGKVVDQNPHQGNAPANSTVTIVIGVPSSATTTTSVPPTSTT